MDFSSILYYILSIPCTKLQVCKTPFLYNFISKILLFRVVFAEFLEIVLRDELHAEEFGRETLVEARDEVLKFVKCFFSFKNHSSP